MIGVLQIRMRAAEKNQNYKSVRTAVVYEQICGS